MTKSTLPADDAQLLSGTAELFMWLGWDRAADFIWAALEAEPEAATCACTDSSAGTWADVFAR